jgi:hypothetical protein
MDIRFLRDYRGQLTAERYYRAGETVSLPNGEAMRLIAQGVCEPVAQESKPPAKKARK